jgi:hypothetical protein
MIQSRAIKTFDPTERLYCSVATAIVGGAAIMGGASIYGANKAADAQTNAANAAIAQQNAMYQKNTAVLNPFIQAGSGQIASQQALLDPNNANGPLMALNNLTGAGPGGPTAMNTALASTPGYQFNLSQGLNSVNNALAARGLGGSGGAVAKGASQYAEGLAGNTWQSVVAALQNQFNSQTGAGQNLINTGTQAGSALAGVGTSTANANSSALIGAGNAQAAAANATGAAVGGIGSSLGTAALLQQITGNSGAGGVYQGASSVGGAPLSGYEGVAPQTYGLSGLPAIA